MKLIDLNPQFLNSGGEGVFNADHTPARFRKGVGIVFDCPCDKKHEEHNKQCVVMFNNPLDGGDPFPNHPY